MAGETWDAPNQQVVRNAPPAAPTEPAQFDPGDHTVDEVKAYVTAMPGTAQSVLAAEENGKARSSLLGWLDEQTEEDLT